MPAFDTDRPAVFFYFPLHGACPQSKPDQIALAEPRFRHGLFSVITSPRSAAKQCLQVIVHCPIGRASQRVYGTPPASHPCQMKRGNASRRYRIEVLMCIRVSPVNQFLKQFAPALVPRVQGVHFCPKIDSQSIEIRTDGAGMRIASAKTSIPNKFRPQESSKLRRDDCDNVIDALRMQIPTETLKVRSQECGIRIIDLLGRITPASLGPANQPSRARFRSRLTPRPVPRSTGSRSGMALDHPLSKSRISAMPTFQWRSSLAFIERGFP
jgi:hypothetical protein